MVITPSVTHSAGRAPVVFTQPGASGQVCSEEFHKLFPFSMTFISWSRNIMKKTKCIWHFALKTSDNFLQVKMTNFSQELYYYRESRGEILYIQIFCKIKFYKFLHILIL